MRYNTFVRKYEITLSKDYLQVNAYRVRYFDFIIYYFIYFNYIFNYIYLTIYLKNTLFH